MCSHTLSLAGKNTPASTLPPLHSKKKCETLPSAQHNTQPAQHTTRAHLFLSAASHQPPPAPSLTPSHPVPITDKYAPLPRKYTPSSPPPRISLSSLAVSRSRHPSRRRPYEMSDESNISAVQKRPKDFLRGKVALFRSAYRTFLKLVSANATNHLPHAEI